MSSVNLYGICNWVGLNESGNCGYCNGEKDGPKHTISGFFYQVQCHFYEKLLCRQWRRCGKYYYQPQNKNTCCPQYTIRVNAFDFRMTSKHRRIERKVEHWLKTGERKLPVVKTPSKISKKHKKKRGGEISLFHQMDKVITDAIESCMKKGLIHSLSSFKVTTKRNKKIKNIDVEKYQFGCSVVFQLLGLIRKLKDPSIKIPDKLELAKIITSECLSLNPEPNDLFTEICAHSSGFLHISVKPEKLQELTTKPIKNEEQEEEEEESSQHHIKRDPIEEAIETELHPAEFRREEYLLYRSYQVNVHKDEKDEVTQSGYKRFLCESSLKREPNQPNNPKPLKGYGTYHLAYRLKNTRKLIGVSVLDILPGGASSVYFFYDTNYQFLDLGKYSALYELQNLFFKKVIIKTKENEVEEEIEGEEDDDDEKKRKKKKKKKWKKGEKKVIVEKVTKFPEFKYFYLGFYIHDCVKMRYKAQYKPHEIMCNVTWKWCDLKHAQKVLDSASFGKFYDQKEEELEEDGFSRDDISEEKLNNTLCYYEGRLYIKETISAIAGGEVKEGSMKKIEEFHKAMGPWASSVAYYLDSDDIDAKKLDTLYELLRMMKQQGQQE